MRAIKFANFNAFVRPMAGCLALVLAFALLAFNVHPTATANPGQVVQDMPDSPQATFPANAPTLGAIPDGPGACNAYGANRDVTFTVSGISGVITNVEVNLTLSPQHTWVGDLDVRLIPPGGTPEFIIFNRTGATVATAAGSLNDAAGPYNFKDSAPAAPTWWQAAAAATVPIPTGSYRTSSAGEVAGGGANTLITPIYAGLGAAANGTWTLRFRDHCSADTGSVSAASLVIDAGPTVVPQHVVDFDGDGKTDPAVVRNTGGGPSGQVTWFILNSLGSPVSTSTPWGIASDFFVPEDYDGDGKTDIAVWRGGAPFNSYFYILQSQTGTLRIDQFGQTGDDPTVVGDYDGDGKADPAVYRGGVAAGDISFWYYRSSVNGLIIGTDWGQNGDFPAPGDYDGDGKGDFGVQRSALSGQARFYFKLATGAAINTVVFGTPTDVIVPGDYDGDQKTDIATIRGVSGQIQWHILSSLNGTTSIFTFGASATDFPTQGDWDGDGKTDIATWRPNADPTQNFFRWRRSSDGFDAQAEWGQQGDYPVANFNTH